MFIILLCCSVRSSLTVAIKSGFIVEEKLYTSNNYRLHAQVMSNPEEPMK